MKTVVSTSQAAHLFANQSQPNARNGKNSFFFAGRIAYSWRYSWPAAVVTPWKNAEGLGVVLVRNDAPSNSSRRHVSKLRDAFRGLPFALYDMGDGMREREAADVMTSAAHSEKCPNFARDARAAIVGAYVKRAESSAASVYALRSADRIAYAFSSAAERYAEARALAHIAKGNERAHLLAVIRKSEASVPAGMLSAASDYAAARTAQYRVGWGSDTYAQAERLADASRDTLAGLVAVERRAMADRSRLAAIATACKAARTHEKIARKADSVRTKKAQLESAAREWKRADTLATKAKRPAAERRTYRDAAARCLAAAARLAPRVAVVDGLELRANLHALAVNLARALAAGRRRTRHWCLANYSRPGLRDLGRRMAASPGVPQAWRDVRDRVFKGIAAHAVIAATASAENPRAYVDGLARDALGKQYGDVVADLVKAGRADLVRDLVHAARSVDTVARTLRDCIVRREAAGYLVTEARLLRAHLAAGPDAVTLENADNIASSAARFLAYAQDAEAAGIGRAAVPILRHPRSAVYSLRDRAQVFADIAKRLNTSRAQIKTADTLAASMRDAAEVFGAGLVFDAQRKAERVRVEWDAARKARASQHDAAVRELDKPENEGFPTVTAAFRDVLKIADAEGVALESLRGEFERVAYAIGEALTAARADVIAHYRATGEKAPGFDDHVHGAIFRRGANGDIVSSMGAQVSETAGRRLWALIRAAVSAGRSRTWPHGEGPHVGPFTLRNIGADGSAVVGCHTITAREARAFAEHMAWPPFGASTDADVIAGGDA